MKDLAFLGLAELASHLRAGDFTSVEVTRNYLDRIARLDTKAHAYVNVYEESAMLQAQAADLQRQCGLPLPPLHGLPIALKDLAEIEGQITTAGSRSWDTRRSTITGAVYERLQAAGMILLGKLHTTEFAFGSWGTNPMMGTPRNPWDWDGQHRVTGGSSSGAGVAVAAGLAPAAIGSDTGGSIRIPASFNGLTGVKTTRGLISLYGHVPLSVSFDTVGTLTHTADDASMLLGALSGFDWRDPATLNQPRGTWNPDRAIPLRKLRIAVMRPEQYPWEVDADVQKACDDAIKTLVDLGAIAELVEVPVDFDQMMRNHSMISVSEAYQVHGSHVENPDAAINSFIRRRILSGKDVSAREYIEFQEDRRRAITIFNDWMQSYDLLATPTLPAAACPLQTIGDEDKNPFIASGNVAFNRAAPYLDACAISLHAGFSDAGMPIGVQLIAKGWHENLLVNVGRAFQQATDWHLRRPPGLQ